MGKKIVYSCDICKKETSETNIMTIEVYAKNGYSECKLIDYLDRYSHWVEDEKILVCFDCVGPNIRSKWVYERFKVPNGFKDFLKKVGILKNE